MSNVKKEEITCIWCLRGLQDICQHEPGEKQQDESEEVETEHVTYKTESSLLDQQSTGRKRAAKLYPLFPGAPCEWTGQKNMGGGSHPIDGCGLRVNSNPGTQQCRHHGPDKNTLNNERGNVHRICTPCHNFGIRRTIKIMSPVKLWRIRSRSAKGLTTQTVYVNVVRFIPILNIMRRVINEIL